MRKYIRWAGAAAALVTFWWAYGMTRGDILGSLNFALKVVLLFVVADVFWLKPKKDKEASGLSEDQWVIKKSGGLAELRKHLKSNRVAAWSFLVIPFGVFLFASVCYSFGAGFLFGGVFGVILFPCSIYLFCLVHKTVKVLKKAASVE